MVDIFLELMRHTGVNKIYIFDVPKFAQFFHQLINLNIAIQNVTSKIKISCYSIIKLYIS